MPKKKKPPSEPGKLSIRDKIKAKSPEWKKTQEEHQAERHRKVEHKKAQQRRMGWSPDKSPV